MKLFIVMMIVLLSPTCFAGGILAQGIVYNVANSTGNTADNFVVFVKSTTTVPCPEGYGIVFFASNAPNQQGYNRSFVIALTALTAGQKVIIYTNVTNPTSNDCSSAANITVQTN